MVTALDGIEAGTSEITLVGSAMTDGTLVKVIVASVSEAGMTERDYEKVCSAEITDDGTYKRIGFSTL